MATIMLKLVNKTLLPSEENDSYWSDWPCHTKMGFACEVVGNVHLELLGLCDYTHFDTNYIGAGSEDDRYVS